MKKKEKSFDDSRKWHRYQFIGTSKITVPDDRISVDATIGNISLSGIGLYSPEPIGRGKKVRLKIAFIDHKGKVSGDLVEGRVDWQSRLKKVYLVGVLFNEELNAINQPKLMEHLAWLIDTFKWPSPFKDRRIATL